MKGNLFETFDEIFFSETIRRMKLIAYMIHVLTLATTLIVFLFQLDKNSGCYGNLYWEG